MDRVAETYHLKCRKGVWYYRRRVPDHLVGTFGKAVIQHSLDTKSLKQAKRRREVADIEWSARFSAAEGAPPDAGPVPIEQTASTVPHTSNARLKQLVWDYVARTDARFQERIASEPPTSEDEKSDIKMNIEMDLQVIQDRDDPNGAASIYLSGKRILETAGIAPDQLGTQSSAFNELVRRALIELDRRKLAHIQDDHSHGSFDAIFNGARPPDVPFSQLAEQRLQQVKEEAAANGTSRKWIDKQRAAMALICEIIGDATPVGAIDYDICMSVRSTLARAPTNRSKLYKKLTLNEAIARAAAQGKATMAPLTQQYYLRVFKDVLDLAAKKRLITVNPALDLRPLKRDDVAPGDKRYPFTPEQIVQFFRCDFYERCASSGPAPYRYDTKGGWRFWLPLICLFTGMRPNEVCQLHVGDVQQTKLGTWYFDVVTTSIESDDKQPASKTLKTASSRRKVPIHPELLKMGFLQFVADRQAATTEPNLFPATPDQYGNLATYPLKRFRDHFFPQAIKLAPRQTFYSFRHNFRDALRRIGAPAETLQALGGWSQGKRVSDNYGDHSDPDFQVQFINRVAYAGLNLRNLYIEVGAGAEN